MNLLRNLRGALGLGVTWGLAWAALGTALGYTIGFFDPASIDPGEEPVIMGLIIGVQGLVAGTGFGALLSFSEARKTILDLSLMRVALFGGIAAATLPLISGAPPGMLPFLCPLGALCATATVAIARRPEVGTIRETV